MCTVRCCCEMRFHHWVEEGKERSKKVSNESKKRSSGVDSKESTDKQVPAGECVCKRDLVVLVTKALLRPSSC